MEMEGNLHPYVVGFSLWSFVDCSKCVVAVAIAGVVVVVGGGASAAAAVVVAVMTYRLGRCFQTELRIAFTSS